MRNLVILLALTLPACGAESYIDSAFIPYLEDFPAEVTVSIQFVDKIDNGATASCIHAEGAIVVSRLHWDHYSEVGKKALLWHELGHCVLDMRHTDDRESLMYFIVEYTSEDHLVSGSDELTKLFLETTH